MNDVLWIDRSSSLLEDLIDRTESMLPAISARAMQTERDRRLPPETVRDIREAGLDRVMQPVVFGGYGLDFDAYYEIGWRLSSACGSTGWVYAQSAVHKWMISRASRKAQADVYAEVDVPTCCAFNPRGALVEPAELGWMISGRWQFASGCLHAKWALLSAVVKEGEAPVLLLVPRDQFDIDDTWHVSGLRGTGSNDIVIAEPLFVPGYRFVPVQISEKLDAATCANGSFAAPQPAVTPWAVVMPVIGMAVGALRAYEDTTRTRLTSFGGQAVAQMAGPQMRISEAASKIDAAHALARSNIREIIQRGASGDQFSVEDRVRFRRDHAFAVNLCYDATMMLARSAGAASLFDHSPIQRFMRDVHAGSMQVASNWDEQAESYGRVRLGLDPNGMMW